MEEYLQLLEELKALGSELISSGEATDEVYCMDMHLACAISIVQDEMEEEEDDDIDWDDEEEEIDY